jgi:hypothetical protein
MGERSNEDANGQAIEVLETSMCIETEQGLSRIGQQDFQSFGDDSYAAWRDFVDGNWTY